MHHGLNDSGQRKLMFGEPAREGKRPATSSPRSRTATRNVPPGNDNRKVPPGNDNRRGELDSGVVVVDEEIHATRAELNAVLSGFVPQLASRLPSAGTNAATKSQLTRPASGATQVRGAPLSSPRSPLATAHAARTAAQRATTRPDAFHHLPPTSPSHVEEEIMCWRRQAAERNIEQHQSVFQWAMSELDLIDVHDAGSIPDGPASTVPSHFSVHAIFTILQELLSALCPLTELRTRLLEKLRQALFLPRHELVQTFCNLGHSKEYLSILQSRPMFEFSPGGGDNEESSDDSDSSSDDTSTSSHGGTCCAGTADASPVDQGGHTAADVHVMREATAEENAAAAADAVGCDASWALVLQLQDARIGTLLQRLKTNNSAIVALRGLLRSVFGREDKRRQRLCFTAWRRLVETTHAQQHRLTRYFDHTSMGAFKGMFFRRWARAVAVGRRQRLIRVKDEALLSAKQMERKLKEAVQAGREEVTRELEKVKATLSEERGSRERQQASVLVEMETLGDRIAELQHYLKLTITHKSLWRSLWLTHHRENRLPQLLCGAVHDEALKFRDSIQGFFMGGGGAAKTRSPPHPAVDDFDSDSPALSNAPCRTMLSVSSSQPSGSRSAVRLKLESLLIAWVNDVLVRLHVQRFLIAIRDDLSDGIIFAALAFALDRTRSPAERFVEDATRRLSPAVLGRRLVGALKQASRRSASCFQGIPMLQLCPTLHEHFDERTALSLTSSDDPWYVWALSTLFVDYCMLQVYPELCDEAAHIARPLASKRRQGVGDDNNSAHQEQDMAHHAAPAVSSSRMMFKDGMQFLVQRDRRSDLFLGEMIQDAADYIASSTMRPPAGGATTAVLDVALKRVSASSGSSKYHGAAPSPSIGGTGPKAPVALSSAKLGAPQKLRPVTAFGPTSPQQTPSVSPAVSSLALRRKVPAPPQGASTSTTTARPRKGPNGRVVSPTQSSLDGTGRSQLGSRNVSPTSNSPSPDDRTEFLLDASDLASGSLGPTPVGSPEKGGGSSHTMALEQLLPLTRGLTEHSGIAQVLNEVLGLPLDDDGDDDGNENADRDGPAESPGSPAAANAADRKVPLVAGAGRFDEFDALLATIAPPPPQHAADLEEGCLAEPMPDASCGPTPTATHIVGPSGLDGLPYSNIAMYDAVVCGALQTESMRRKTAWCDAARLVVTAVATYGVLERPPLHQSPLDVGRAGKGSALSTSSTSAKASLTAPRGVASPWDPRRVSAGAAGHTASLVAPHDSSLEGLM